MKPYLFASSLLLFVGNSCQQPIVSNNSQKDFTIINNESQILNFAQQDSLMAVSILENEENDSSSTIKFSQRFLTFLEQNQSTISYDFPKLKETGMYIVNSSDGKLRIYSWDDNQGGSMRYFNSIFQAKLPENQILNLISTKEDRIYYPFYTRIETIELEGQTYYIAFARNVLSHREVNYSVELYKIENNQISPAKLFRLNNNLDYVLGETFNYDELADSDQEFIQLETKGLTLSFPEVTEDGKFSKKRSTYQFKDKYFQKK